MNLIIYLIAGAIVGYVASRIMRTNSQQGLLLDIVVGVVGAFLAGYFISPLLGVGTINDAIHYLSNPAGNTARFHRSAGDLQGSPSPLIGTACFVLA